jgi:hypothetical protein
MSIDSKKARKLDEWGVFERERGLQFGKSSSALYFK